MITAKKIPTEDKQKKKVKKSKHITTKKSMKKQTKRWKERKIGTKELQSKQENINTVVKYSFINNYFKQKQFKFFNQKTEWLKRIKEQDSTYAVHKRFTLDLRTYID